MLRHAMLCRAVKVCAATSMLKPRHQSLRKAAICIMALICLVRWSEPSLYLAGCADTMDIGEQSYSMVLADDLDNNGRMDLLVSTMNGNLYALETAAVYHPMKAWTSVVRLHGTHCSVD